MEEKRNITSCLCLRTIFLLHAVSSPDGIDSFLWFLRVKKIAPLLKTCVLSSNTARCLPSFLFFIPQKWNIRYNSVYAVLHSFDAPKELDLSSILICYKQRIKYSISLYQEPSERNTNRLWTILVQHRLRKYTIALLQWRLLMRQALTYLAKIQCCYLLQGQFGSNLGDVGHQQCGLFSSHVGTVPWYPVGTAPTFLLLQTTA